MKALVFLAAAFAATLNCAAAQDYPSRNITILVPFTAGGPNDLAARALSPDAGVSRADFFDADLTEPIPAGVLAAGTTTHFLQQGVSADTIDPNGFPIGGNATVVFNGEVRVPVRGGLSVVSFFDSGNVFQRVSQLSLSEFRNAVGFGVRYRSPFGPLRVDLGFKTRVETFTCTGTDNVARPCAESRPALHISFGQAF